MELLAQAGSVGGAQGKVSWKVGTIQKERKEAQVGKGMAQGKVRLVVGRQVWKAMGKVWPGQKEPAFKPWHDHTLLAVRCITSTLLLMVERFSALCPL